MTKGNVIHALEPRRLLSGFVLHDLNNDVADESLVRALPIDGSNGYVVRNTLEFGYELYKVANATSSNPVITLIKDISAGPASSSPANFVRVGALAYFTADDGVHGEELWRTDGTADGTRLVSDLNALDGSRPLQVTALADGSLIFTADDGVHGRKPWVISPGGALSSLGDISKGSTGLQSRYLLDRSMLSGAPTKLLAVSIVDDQEHSSLITFDSATDQWHPVTFPDSKLHAHDDATLLGDTLYFTAEQSNLGRQLFKVAAGSTVAQRVGNSSDWADWHPSDLAVFNGKLYFAAASTVAVNRELWSTDGTSTALAIDVRAGDVGSDPKQLTVHANRLYFVSTNAKGNRVLGSTMSGTSATVLTARGVNIVGKTASVLYYTQQYDGGSYLVQHFSDSSIIDLSYYGRDPRFLSFSQSGAIYIGQRDHASQQLHVYSLGRTSVIGDIPFAGSTPDSFVTIGERMFFVANDALGRELRIREADGTIRTLDLVEGPESSGIRDLSALGSRVIFFANTPGRGLEPWVSDGTIEGTMALPETVAGIAGANRLSEIAVVGTLAYWTCVEGGATAVFVSDGTAAGTKKIKKISSSSSATTTMTAIPGRFFMLQETAGFRELWTSDGTEAGTVRLAQFGITTWFSWASLNGQIVIALSVSLTPAECGIWFSDGTPAGTRQVINAEARYIAATDKFVAFSSSPLSGSGYEPWRSDGTVAGTYRLADVYPGGAGSEPLFFTAFGPDMLFRVRIGPSAWWRTDGTTGGTRAMSIGSAGSPFPDKLYVTPRGQLTGFADDASGTRRLFQFDPRGSGAVPLETITPRLHDGGHSAMVPHFDNDTLFLVADDGVTGDELYSLAYLELNPIVQDVRLEPDHLVAPAFHITFSKSVGASLTFDDFELRLGETVIAASDLDYDAASNTAILSLPPLAPTGSYTVSWRAGGICDVDDRRLVSDGSVTETFLVGDLNRDRTVDFSNLLILAQNYGQSGRTFSQGNLDYSPDGKVDFDDLLILAQRYGTSLAVGGIGMTDATSRRRSRVDDVLA